MIDDYVEQFLPDGLYLSPYAMAPRFNEVL